MKLNKILAATAAMAIATTALPALAGVYVSNDQASFDKIRKGIQTFDFSFTKDVNLGKSYTQDGVTFKSNDMYGLNDKGTGYTPVLANISGDFSISYKGPVLALDLISTKSEVLNYTVNGVSQTLKLAAYTPTFLGFDTSSATVGLNVVFDATCSSSINLLGFQTAVPEAATWAMMMVGLGVVGGSLRRRRTAAPSVRFA